MTRRLLFVFLLFSGVRSDLNITVDDGSPSIDYRPPGSWNLSAQSNLDVGGYHRLTVDGAATANFTFTGIAVYLMSPRWPYLVNTQVSLDSGSPILVDLVDHSRPNAGQGPETVQSQVVWGASGLPNTQHSLVMSVGGGQPYAIVDSLIYTVPGSNPSTTSPVNTIGSSTATPVATSENGTKRNTSHVLPIVVGIAAGFCGLLLLALLAFVCIRSKRRKRSQSNGYPNSLDTSIVNPVNSIGGPWIVPSVKHQENVVWPNHGQSPTMLVPGAMPYGRPFSEVSNSSTNGSYESQWPEMISPVRAPNRLPNSNVTSLLQPNTLSTITETSSPLGGTASLLHASSFQSGLTTNDTMASHSSPRTSYAVDGSANSRFGASNHHFFPMSGGSVPTPQPPPYG